MKTREQAEKRALELFPKNTVFESGMVVSRKAYLQALDDMQKEMDELREVALFLLQRMKKDREKQRFSVRLALDKLEETLSK